MTIDTQMSLLPLEELLMAICIEEPAREIAAEGESDSMVPLLVEEEREGLMPGQLEGSI